MKVNIYEQCLDLGYQLERNKKDNLGNNYPYRTRPIDKGGFINYFYNKQQVERWMDQVIEKRGWENG